MRISQVAIAAASSATMLFMNSASSIAADGINEPRTEQVKTTPTTKPVDPHEKKRDVNGVGEPGAGSLKARVNQPAGGK